MPIKFLKIFLMLLLIVSYGYPQDTVFVQNGTGKIKKTAVQSLYENALQFYDDQRYAETIDLTRRIVAQYPENYEAFYLRGLAKEKMEDHAGALSDYDITLHLQPDYAEAKFRRALLLFKMQKYARAMDDFKNLLQQSGTETQAVFFKGQDVHGNFQAGGISTLQSDMQAELYNYIGLSEMYLKHFPMALAYFDSAIAHQAGYPDWYNNRGMLKEKLQDTTGALQDYQTALQIAPGHTDALQNLSALARQSNQEEVLEKAVTNAVSEDASASSYFQRGLLLQEKGYLQEALLDFDSALALDSRIPDYYLQRGFLKEKLNDLTGALEDYTASLRLDPLVEKAYTNRGNIYFKLKKYEQAVKDYQQALQLNPSHGIIYFNRGLAYHHLKKREASCRDLQKAVDLGYAQAKKALEAYCRSE